MAGPRADAQAQEQRLARADATHQRDAECRREQAEDARQDEVGATDRRGGAGKDSKLQRRRNVGDLVSDQRRRSDRCQACDRVAAGHKLEGIKGAGERRRKGSRNGASRAAADQDA